MQSLHSYRVGLLVVRMAGLSRLRVGYYRVSSQDSAGSEHRALVSLPVESYELTLYYTNQSQLNPVACLALYIMYFMMTNVDSYLRPN